MKSHWIQSYHDKWTMCGRYEANKVHRTVSITHVTCANCKRIIKAYEERDQKARELTARFRELVEADETLSRLIDYIKVEPQGCSYLWEGIMNCHLVMRLHYIYDVQDVEDHWKPWKPRVDGSNTFESRTFKSVEDYVEDLKRAHCRAR